jgi:hypothetical protein
MIAENIACKIMGNHTQIINCGKYSLSYLSQAFNLPFTNTVFHNTSNGEIEKNHSLLPLEKFMWV